IPAGLFLTILTWTAETRHSRRSPHREDLPRTGIMRTPSLLAGGAAGVAEPHNHAFMTFYSLKRGWGRTTISPSSTDRSPLGRPKPPTAASLRSPPGATKRFASPRSQPREQGKQAANKTLWRFFQITHNRTISPRTRA